MIKLSSNQKISLESIIIKIKFMITLKFKKNKGENVHRYKRCNLYETVRHIDTKKEYIFFGYHSKTWPMKWKKTLLFLQFGEKKYS